MQFVKMQGAGNDYIYLDCFAQPRPDDPAALARRLSDRHFGIGADGLILILPSSQADARMRMFNADGSEAEMCGNGMRCLAKYVYDHGLCPETKLRIETAAGVIVVEVFPEDGRVRKARVDMGRPVLKPEQVPTTLPGNPRFPAGAAAEVELDVAGETLRVTCVSMGNPHCVVFVDEPDDRRVLGLGPRIETHPSFPNRVNAEFVKVVSPEEVVARVWERGSGETLACGTGACAVCVAGALTGRTGRRLCVRLPGGVLEIEWAEDDHVYLTGPAVEVFTGTMSGEVGGTAGNRTARL